MAINDIDVQEILTKNQMEDQIKHLDTSFPSLKKTFLQLLSKNFPKDHEMHKVFNKNTLKISYTFMNNISSILSTHNKGILNPKQTSFGCSRRNKDHCPLDSECLT